MAVGRTSFGEFATSMEGTAPAEDLPPDLGANGVGVVPPRML